MIRRAVPPVHSPIRPMSIVRAAAAELRPLDGVHRSAADAIRSHFGVEPVALTDSGTSALLLALRIAGVEAPVAMPGYACIDLIAAARGSGARVSLYDIEPRTLSPDVASLRKVLETGARVVVIVHLFGYPVDVGSVRALCDEFDATLIEDAAQGIGGSYAGKPLGAHGDLSVLSFGRGKGANACGGGALLASAEWVERARPFAPSTATAPSNWRALGAGVAQWCLGRPSLYAIPLAIPALRLGEMIYTPAGEPRALSASSAALVPEALASGARASIGRRARSERILSHLSGEAHPVQPIPAAVSGALRLPVLLPSGTRNNARLGALRPYPVALCDHEAGAGQLVHPIVSTGGSRELANRLFSLPVHEQVRSSDEHDLLAWVKEAGRK